jgi:hypothetical protein
MSASPVLPSPIKPFRLNYTQRDFNTIVEEIRNIVPAQIPEWNDFVNSNVGSMIIDIFAAFSDLAGFYVDRQAAECYVGTCISMDSMTRLLQLINYQVRTLTPGYITLQITAALQGADLIIPAYSIFTTSDGTIKFVTLQDATILNNYGSTGSTATINANGIVTNYIQVVARQGYLYTDSFVSDGSADQIFVLSQTNIGDITQTGFLIVEVSSTDWSLADLNSFVGYASTDEVYCYQVISNQEQLSVQIEFGDNVEGMIPPPSTPIAISYLITAGNTVTVITGQVNKTLSTFQDNLGNTIAPQIVNLSPMYGAAPQDTVNQARANYPAAFKTLGRAVTVTDFLSQAEAFAGVLQAAAFDVNDDPTIPFYEVDIYVVPTTGTSSSALNSTLQAYLSSIATVDKIVLVNSPTTVVFNVAATITIYASYNLTSVYNQVVAAVTAFFAITSNGTIQIGTSIPLSQLSAVMQNIAGVNSVVITSPVSTDNSMDVDYDEIIQLGTLRISATSV